MAAAYNYKKITVLNTAQDGLVDVVMQLRPDGLTRAVSYDEDEVGIIPTSTHKDLVEWFEDGNTFSNNLKEITGITNPTGSESADVGWIYTNTESNRVYICTAKNETTCTWRHAIDARTPTIPTPPSNKEKRNDAYIRETDPLLLKIYAYDLEIRLSTVQADIDKATAEREKLEDLWLEKRGIIRQTYPQQQ
jgi:hypothetical protein